MELPPNLIEQNCTVHGGFSRPDWVKLRAVVRADHLTKNRNELWLEIARQWFGILRDELGGKYRIAETGSLVLLSDLDDEDTGKICQLVERTSRSMKDLFGGMLNLDGKHLVILFDEEDDFFSYICHYYPEGTNGRPSACFVRDTLGHIAVNHSNGFKTQFSLVHELTHDFMSVLPRIPLWLNEGMAQHMTDWIFQIRFNLSVETADELREYWNEDNIQEFWAGTGFKLPLPESHQNYKLAEIMLHLLAARKQPLADFLMHADFRDSGQDAALRYLDVCLGSIVGEFLGRGDWRPRRKAIAELRAQYRARFRKVGEPDAGLKEDAQINPDSARD